MTNLQTMFRRSTVRGYELRQGVEQLTHHLAKALRLGTVMVTWTAETTTAAINARGTILVAAVRDDATITRPTLVRYCGFIIHELLHRAHTQFGAMHTIQGRNANYRRALLNAVEDARIERLGIATKALGNIEQVLHDLMGQMVSEALAEVQDWSNAAQYPFAIAVALRNYPGLTVPMPIEVQRIASQALARMPQVNDTAQALVLSEWIYNQLRAAEQEQQQDEQQDEQQDDPQDGQGEQQDPQGEPQDGEGQGEGQGQGQDAEGNGQDAEGEAEGQGQGEGEGQGQAPKMQPMQEEMQDAREVEPNLGNRPENQGTVGTWCKTKGVTHPGVHVQQGRAAAVQTNAPARLRYELRRLFENTATTLHVNNRKAGRINPQALARSGFTDTVFRRRLDIEGVDSAVVICLDVSGSMYDYPGRIAAAIPAAHALAETLMDAGVAVAVVTFGTRASVCVPFDTPKRKTLQTIRDVYSNLEDTNDYAALRVAHDMLMSRKEPRRAVFVISDGCGNVPAMKQQIAAGQGLGITTLGVGICLDVSRIYGAQNCVTVNDPQDLGTAAFSKMKMAA
jgi:cobalamin biosynthesis protein CobT